MTLNDLIYTARLYTRDNNSYMFSDSMVTLFINQAIDRIRQYKYFVNMKHLSSKEDEPNLLPSQYHYMLALFASSRCFEHDERFYESVEKRNEFESLLDSLISDVQLGNIVLIDEDGNAIKDDTSCIDYVVDAYFNVNGGEE